MAKWKCTYCNGKDDPCILEVDETKVGPKSCPYDTINSQGVNWKLVKEKKETTPKKKLTIEAINSRELYLSNGKKYKKTFEPANCDKCCFKPKLDGDGLVYKNMCLELGLGYSKCGNRVWKRDKE